MRLARLSSVLLVLVLCAPLMGQDYNEQFRRRAAAADDYRADDFNRASLGTDDWYDEDTTWSIVSSTTLFVTTKSSLIHKTATTSTNQWVCLQVEDDHDVGYFDGLYYGPKVRFDSNADPDTGDQYTVRVEGSTCEAACNLQARSCSDSTCSDVGPELDFSPEYADGDWICVEVEGTGASTILRVWNQGSSDPCDGAGASGPSYWGDPDFCLGDSTSSLTGCDCGVDTTCYDSVGVGCANTPCLDGIPAYADCGGANCYIGAYTGGNADSWMDNFCGGSS